MIEGYKTVSEVAKEWGLSERRVRTMCASNLIDGAAKFGREWAIPTDVNRPADKRVTSGEYKNWRKAREV